MNWGRRKGRVKKVFIFYIISLSVDRVCGVVDLGWWVCWKRSGYGLRGWVVYYLGWFSLVLFLVRIKQRTNFVKPETPGAKAVIFKIVFQRPFLTS